MMAYPYDDARMILALQIDHSRVAGYFAAHWGNRVFDRPEPYSSVVLAATEHDIGWWEWEMKPSTLNDKGLSSRLSRRQFQISRAAPARFL